MLGWLGEERGRFFIFRLERLFGDTLLMEIILNLDKTDVEMAEEVRKRINKDFLIELDDINALLLFLLRYDFIESEIWHKIVLQRERIDSKKFNDVRA